jgi:hypothetical protein
MKMSDLSLQAISLLGDMLEEKETQINDKNPATDEEMNRELESLNELWTHYVKLSDSLYQNTGDQK